MALIRRFSRLLTADAHAVLDRMEDPLSALRQSIREMEEALGALEARIAGTENEIAACGKRETTLQQVVAECDAQLDLCFAEGNDGLARNVVRRKLEATRAIAWVRETREHLAAEATGMNALAEQQREELASLRLKAELVVDSADAGTAEASATTPNAADIEIALLAEKQARKQTGQPS